MRVFFIFFFILIINLGAKAQSNSSSVFRFLDLTPTARAASLGGNHIGLYNADFSLFHLNPAYLNAKSSQSISATYINFLADANMGFTSGALNVKNLGTFGVGIRYIGYGDFDYLDQNGDNLGNFNANDFAVSGAYSREVLENLNVGVAVDFIYSSYASYKSSAAAVSGGLFYQDDASHFSAGLSVRNLGGQVSAFNEQREPLPLDIAIGISKKPEAFPFQLSFTMKKLNDWDLRTFGESEQPDFVDNLLRHALIGGEAAFTDSFFLRLGYDYYLHEQTKTGKTIDLAGATFGIGFKIKSIIIDLSRNAYSKLGGITRISLKTEIK